MKMTAISGRVRTATRRAHVVNLMTNPVDADALRKTARAVGMKYRSALAAEIECDTLAAADEIDLLRAVIAARPHDDLCEVWANNGGTSDVGCTCWKAGVL